MTKDPEINQTQPRKPYRAPQLVEHGAIAKITGDLNMVFAVSVIPDGLGVQIAIK